MADWRLYWNHDHYDSAAKGPKPKLPTSQGIRLQDIPCRCGCGLLVRVMREGSSPFFNRYHLWAWSQKNKKGRRDNVFAWQGCV